MLDIIYITYYIHYIILHALYILLYCIHITFEALNLNNNLLVNAVIRLLRPESGDSQGQETFLAPSADKQTHNYDTRVLKAPSIPINPKVKRIEP